MFGYLANFDLRVYELRHCSCTPEPTVNLQKANISRRIESKLWRCDDSTCRALLNRRSTAERRRNEANGTVSWKRYPLFLSRAVSKSAVIVGVVLFVFGVARSGVRNLLQKVVLLCCQLSLLSNKTRTHAFSKAGLFTMAAFALKFVSTVGWRSTRASKMSRTSRGVTLSSL